jgi:predicted enzyme related to lactoylglutathione lyase
MACGCNQQKSVNRRETTVPSLTEARLSLSQIGQVAINAHDLARATEFYRDMLGIKYLFSGPKMSFFDCGGIRLMLSIPEKPEYDHPSSILYFKVDDIHEAYNSLTSRDVRFESKPALVASMPEYDLWMSFFKDSEDNLLAFMCEVPKSK